MISIKTIFSIDLEEDSLSRAIEADFEQKVKMAKEELEAATPVDTGFARDHWRLTAVNGEEILIENEADYIKYLNQGSSQQAPAHFIENIVINYGTPVGPITEEKN